MAVFSQIITGILDPRIPTFGKHFPQHNRVNCVGLDGAADQMISRSGLLSMYEGTWTDSVKTDLLHAWISCCWVIMYSSTLAGYRIRYCYFGFRLFSILQNNDVYVLLFCSTFWIEQSGCHHLYERNFVWNSQYLL